MKDFEILRETTEWEFPNNTYALHKGQLVGYRKPSDLKFTRFQKPLNFSKKRRTFVKIKATLLTVGDLEDFAEFR